MRAVAEGKTAARSRPERSGDYRTFEAVEARRAAPSGCSVRSSPMLSGTNAAGQSSARGDTSGRWPRERRLSDADMRLLGRAPAGQRERPWPPAIAAARFLVLTGWRTARHSGSAGPTSTFCGGLRARRHQDRPKYPPLVKRGLRCFARLSEESDDSWCSPRHGAMAHQRSARCGTASRNWRVVA